MTMMNGITAALVLAVVVPLLISAICYAAFVRQKFKERRASISQMAIKDLRDGERRPSDASTLPVKAPVQEEGRSSSDSGAHSSSTIV